MTHEVRAVDEANIRRIQTDIFNGLYNDLDISTLFQTISVQREVLRQLFNLFTTEPMKLVSTSDPVRNSTLTHLKELVSMEDGQ